MKVKASNSLCVPSQAKRLRAHLDRRLEVIGVARADRAVDAVGGDDQVGIGEFGDVMHLAAEDQLHAKIGGAFLQDVEQVLALDAAEAVPARADHAALEVDVDVVPMREAVADALFG